jgi:hypothetical protein
VAGRAIVGGAAVGGRAVVPEIVGAKPLPRTLGRGSKIDRPRVCDTGNVRRLWVGQEAQHDLVPAGQTIRVAGVRRDGGVRLAGAPVEGHRRAQRAEGAQLPVSGYSRPRARVHAPLLAAAGVGAATARGAFVLGPQLVEAFAGDAGRIGGLPGLAVLAGHLQVELVDEARVLRIDPQPPIATATVIEAGPLSRLVGLAARRDEARADADRVGALFLVVGQA